MKTKLASAKNFVARNQTRALVTALAVTSAAVVIQHKGLMQHNEFLKAHDLFDTFYFTGEI